MASESLLELHEAYPFLFYFFSLEKKKRWGVGGSVPLRWISLLSQRRNLRLKVEPAWKVLNCNFHEPRKTLSKWFLPFLFYPTLFFSLKRSFGGKIPLETAGFSHTLLNFPQTFVKELKGINWRNSSVERFTWDMLVIFAVKANQSYRHNSVCTQRPWGSTAPKSVCHALITLEEDKLIVFSQRI